MFDVLFQRAPDGQLYAAWLWYGTLWTLALAVGGWAIAFALGLAVGILRTAPSRPLAALARLYVEIFRNVPLLVQLFLWYFVLPEVLPREWGDALKQMAPPWASFWPALAGLSLYTSARIAEQVRAGIDALPKGQREASAALGIGARKTYRHVIVPQALRLIVPSLTSEAMGIYKNTSVALTIGLLELTAQARAISEATFQTFAAFGAATVIYLIQAPAVYRIMAAIDAWTAVPGVRAAPAGKAFNLGILRRAGVPS